MRARTRRAGALFSATMLGGAVFRAVDFLPIGWWRVAGSVVGVLVCAGFSIAVARRFSRKKV